MDAIFSDIGTQLEALGVWAYVVAPLLMAAVAVLPIPAEAPAMLNGMLFGPVAGSVVTWVGAMVGAWISFEIARACGRPLAERWVRPSALDKADRVAVGAGWWGLLLARFIPVIAFTALNWGAGLTPIARWRFLWTTAVGIAPGVVLFTSSGVGLQALYRWSPAVAAVLAFVVLSALAYWAYGRGRRPAES